MGGSEQSSEDDAETVDSETPGHVDSEIEQMLSERYTILVNAFVRGTELAAATVFAVLFAIGVVDLMLQIFEAVQNGTITDPLVGTKRIINRSSGRAMDVYNIENANGANICIWDYWGGQGQQWIIADVGSGLYSIRSVMSGNRSLDVWEGSSANGTNIALYSYYANPQQQFYIEDLGNGYYRLTPSHAIDSCVDAYGTSNGANVGLWTYWGGSNQQWAIEDP